MRDYHTVIDSNVQTICIPPTQHTDWAGALTQPSMLRALGTIPNGQSNLHGLLRRAMEAHAGSPVEARARHCQRTNQQQQRTDHQSSAPACTSVRFIFTAPGLVPRIGPIKQYHHLQQHEKSREHRREVRVAAPQSSQLGAAAVGAPFKEAVGNKEEPGADDQARAHLPSPISIPLRVWMSTLAHHQE